MNSKKGFIIPVLVFAVILAGGAAVYFYRQSASLKQNPQELAQKEAQIVVDEVGKLIVLPEGEEPTVATITDPEKLKDQPFFANAKEGYKVLIYSNARKAFLYDPVAKKLIEAAPLYIGDAPASTPSSSLPDTISGEN